MRAAFYQNEIKSNNNAHSNQLRDPTASLPCVNVNLKNYHGNWAMCSYEFD